MPSSDTADGVGTAAALLACPACRRVFSQTASSRLSCLGCARVFEVSDGIPNLRLDAPADRPPSLADRRTDAVRRFYAAAPFPHYRDGDTLMSLRERAGRSVFVRRLDAAIAPDARVLDLGCGTGQMTLFLATGDRVVVGADLTRASLALAAAAARRFGVTRALFVETDLRCPGLAPGAFDVVFCSGALHHVPAPSKHFAALVSLLRPGGILVLGVYNAYARFPHRVRRLLSRLTGFRWFFGDAEMRARHADPARRRAWLNDQYRHPEEHRHTVAQVRRWFREGGVDWLCTVPSTLMNDDPHDNDNDDDDDNGDVDDTTAARAATTTGRSLFSAAPDDFWLEALLCQLSWMKTLAHDGGLFITVGRRR